MVNGCVDIEKLGEDQGRESDRNNVCERFVEEHDGAQHNCTTLERRLEEPNEESLDGEGATLL